MAFNPLMREIERIISYAKANPYSIEKIKELYRERKFPYMNPEHSAQITLHGEELIIGYWHELNDDVLVKRINLGLKQKPDLYPHAIMCSSVMNMIGFETIDNFSLLSVGKSDNGLYIVEQNLIPFAYSPILTKDFGRRMNIWEVDFPLVGGNKNDILDTLSILDKEIARHRDTICPKGMPLHSFEAIGKGLQRMRLELHKLLTNF